MHIVNLLQDREEINNNIDMFGHLLHLCIKQHSIYKYIIYDIEEDYGSLDLYYDNYENDYCVTLLTDSWKNGGNNCAINIPVWACEELEFDCSPETINKVLDKWLEIIIKERRHKELQASLDKKIKEQQDALKTEQKERELYIKLKAKYDVKNDEFFG